MDGDEGLDSAEIGRIGLAGGYIVCRGLEDRPCGEWFVPVRGPGAELCSECIAHRGRVLGAAIDVEIVGHVVSVRRRKRSAHRGSYADTEREKAVSKARHRALARLKIIYPTIYEALVAEELAKMGEAPIRTRVDPIRHLTNMAEQASG